MPESISASAERRNANFGGAFKSATAAYVSHRLLLALDHHIDHPATLHTLAIIMASTLSCSTLFSQFFCGVSVRVDGDDGESGNRLPIPPGTKETVKEPGRHAMPGVTALALSSMAVGAAVMPAGPISLKPALFPGAPVIPLIIVTPPAPEPIQTSVRAPRHPQPRSKTAKTSKGSRSPLGLRTNGSLSQRPGGIRSSAGDDKENIKDPQGPARRSHARPVLAPPRLTHAVIPAHQVPAVPTPLIESFKATEPGSSAWEREKVIRLDAARIFSDAVRARRCSLPSPPSASAAAPPATTALALTRSTSAPPRLPVAERLHLAAVRCAPPAPAPVPILRLWGDDNVSFVVGEDDDEDEEEAEAEEEAAVRKAALSRLPDTDAEYCFDAVPEAQHTPPLSVSASTSSSSSPSSSSDSISSVLDDFEELVSSAVWLGLRPFQESKGGASGGMQQEKGEKEGDEGYASAGDGEDTDSEMSSL
ncbi:hypothetical protein DFH06DRAFT_543145 [Mycena polygramma]|nr:hypothetical protein DFH06DRAFT_543145 [Mycena polygramma]